MIGDSKIDVECGINAGCKTGFILGRECDLSPDISANNLLEIVDKII
jgi:phosphoglycolate phosphatase-like HAD superfamily hydrolase